MNGPVDVGLSVCILCVDAFGGGGTSYVMKRDVLWMSPLYSKIFGIIVAILSVFFHGLVL